MRLCCPPTVRGPGSTALLCMQDPLNQARMVALLANLEQRIMTLNVGGLRYVTTAATLAAVENSFLWKLVFLAPPHNSPRSGQSGEFFIDRTNRVRH